MLLKQGHFRILSTYFMIKFNQTLILKDQIKRLLFTQLRLKDILRLFRFYSIMEQMLKHEQSIKELLSISLV